MVPRCWRVLVRYSSWVIVSGPENRMNPHLQSQSSMKKVLPSVANNVCYQLLLIIFIDRFSSRLEIKVTLPMVSRYEFMKLAAIGKHFKCWNSHFLPIPGKNTQSIMILIKGMDVFSKFRSHITIAWGFVRLKREDERNFHVLSFWFLTSRMPPN